MMRLIGKFIVLLMLPIAGLYAQVPVNIVYPINGGSYPIPGGGVGGSGYFTSSFGTTCPGGQHGVKWGFNSTTVGSGTFYDEMSVQFTHKLPSGTHKFWVVSSCGNDSVYFTIL